MYVIQELFFRYGTITLFLVSCFFKEPKRRLQFFSMPVFLLFVILVSMFFNFDIRVRASILNIFFGIFFYKLVVENVDIKEFPKIATWLFWLLFANLVLCLMQTLQIDPIFSHVRPDLMPDQDELGFMRLKATLGCLAVVIAPFLFILSPWLVLVALPLLYHSDSSVSVAAFALVMGFLLYFRFKEYRVDFKLPLLPRINFPLVWLWWITVAVILTGGVWYVCFVDMPMGQFGSRFVIWKWSLSTFLTKSPFFGLGLAKFGAIGPQTMQGGGNPEPLTWIWVHNEFLQGAFETGIIGLTILIIFIRARFEEFKKNWQDREIQALFGSFLAILMISFFHFPFHLGKMAPLCIFLMALYHAKVIERTKNESV